MIHFDPFPINLLTNCPCRSPPDRGDQHSCRDRRRGHCRTVGTVPTRLATSTAGHVSVAMPIRRLRRVSSQPGSKTAASLPVLAYRRPDQPRHHPDPRRFPRHQKATQDPAKHQRFNEPERSALGSDCFLRTGGWTSCARAYSTPRTGSSYSLVELGTQVAGHHALQSE